MMTGEDRIKRILQADEKTKDAIDRLLEGHLPAGEGRSLELLSWSAAARETKISRTTLWRWARDGRLRVIELPGGRTRVARRELEELIAGHLPATTPALKGTKK